MMSCWWWFLLLLTCSPPVHSEYNSQYLDNHFIVYYLTDIMTPNPSYNSTLKNSSPTRLDISMLYEYYLARFLPREVNSLYKRWLLNWNFAFDDDSLMYHKRNLLTFFNYHEIKREIPDILIGPSAGLPKNALSGYNLLNNILHVNHGVQPMWKSKHVLHVQPVDRYRMDVLLRMLKDLDWNFFTVLWSENMINQRNFFTDLSTERKVCISLNIQMPIYEKEICGIFKRIGQGDNFARQLLLFTTTYDSRRILNCMRKLNIDPGRFQLIFFYNHNTDPSVYHGYERWLDGSLSIRTFSKSSFGLNTAAFEENIFKELNPKNNSNKVLLAYWESRNNCYGKSGIFQQSYFKRNCTFGGNETLEPVVGWENSNYITESISMLPFTYYCLTFFLEEFWDSKCFHLFGTDLGEKNCTRSYIGSNFKELFLEAVKIKTKNTFSCNALLKSFAFEVINSRLENVKGVNGELVDTIKSVPVYEWVYHKPTNISYDVEFRLQDMSEENFYFEKLENVYFGKHQGFEVPFGNCSLNCGYGAIKNQWIEEPFCCWKCESCGENEISNDTLCEACPEDTIANITSGQCLPLHLRTINDIYGGWMKYMRVISGILSFFVVLIVIIVFVYRDKELFKLSGLKLWFLMLLCLFVTLVSANSLSLEPSKFVCIFRNVVPSTCLLFTHMIIMLKAIHIHRRYKGTIPMVGRLYDKVDKSIKQNMLSIIGFVFVVIQFVLIANVLVNFNRSSFLKIFESKENGETYLIQECRSIFLQLDYLFHILTCLFGIVQSFFNRKFQGVFYEPIIILVALCLSLCSIVLFIAFCFALPYSQFLHPVAYTRDGIIFTFLVVDSFMLIAAVFAPKCYFALRGYGDEIPCSGSPPMMVHRSASFTARFQETENEETENTRLPMQLDLTASLPIVGSPTKPVFLRD